MSSKRVMTRGSFFFRISVFGTCEIIFIVSETAFIRLPSGAPFDLKKDFNMGKVTSFSPMGLLARRMSWSPRK